jgi:hypothetical protein
VSSFNQLENSLYVREWAAIFLVLSLFLILGISSWRPSIRISGSRPCEATQIEITLMGEVAQPGVYLVSPGTTVKEVLKSISLLKSADRRQIPFKKVLFSSQTLIIPARKQKNLEGKGGPSLSSPSALIDIKNFEETRLLTN